MSNKRFITRGEGLPNWSNPISHAVVVNNICFVSGQLSVNLEGVYISGSILEKGKRAFANFFADLINADFEKQDVVFIDIAFNDLSDLPEIIYIWNCFQKTNVLQEQYTKQKHCHLVVKLKLQEPP